MGFIMHRSFAEAMGFDWPPEVALLEGLDARDATRVTWDDVHDERRKRQARILAWKREPELPDVLPAYVWAFYNRQLFPYHGWYCYVVTRHFQVAVNFQGFDAELATSLMEAIPMGLFPMPENFDGWMKELARRYPRRHPHDPRKAGSVVGWLERKRRFTLERP